MTIPLRNRTLPIFLLLLLLTAAGSQPIAEPEGDAHRLAELVNTQRARVGCRALQWDDRIAAAAIAHSRDMWERSFFDHDTPEGRTVDDRVRLAGVPARGAAGEVLAMTMAPPQEVFRMWMASRRHRRVMESCRYTHHGIGRHGDLWTQVFVSLQP